MFEYAKHEFAKWISQLKTDELSLYETTLIQILIDSFDEIASVGTAKGQRAHTLSKKIALLNQTTIPALSHTMHSSVSGTDIKRLSKLTVEKFRGFLTQVSFDLSKQYSLFYGPNGSGKTSFCEALEYCILGTIEEASARNIQLEKYIRHTGARKAVRPILLGLQNDGSETIVQNDISKYRFAFIEKNRIDAFSHMGATTAKSQAERIAALFGLSEFQNFLAGFTDVFDDRYIQLTDLYQDQVDRAAENLKTIKDSINDERQKESTTKEDVERLFSHIDGLTFSTIDEALDYLNDPNTGRIPQLIKESEKNKIREIDEGLIQQLKESSEKYIEDVKRIKQCEEVLLQNATETDFQALYQAVCNIAKGKTPSVCPACKTPLSQTILNPFEHAKIELSKLKQLDQAQKGMKKYKKDVLSQYWDLRDSIDSSGYKCLFPNDFNRLPMLVPSEDEFPDHTENAARITDIISHIHNSLCDPGLHDLITQYNNRALENNKKYTDQQAHYDEIYKHLIEGKANIAAANKKINEELEPKKEEAEKKLEAISLQAEKHQKEIKFNNDMVQAYYSIIRKLKTYAAELPTVYAKDLAQKAVQYYNIINFGDADFELLNDISIPLRENDKIVVTMADGTKQDAMQILSEGHIKILGLSILLAKAVHSFVPFVIFDDVVNAIDDDHRDGVAKLLAENKDFTDKQIIITCHGELFVQLLEDKIANKKNINRYVFLPADSLPERGIVIHYQDPSIPLAVARTKFQEGHLKDCASKCRQAVECISGKIWNKVVQYSNGGISVKLRDIKGRPDLKQVVDALVKMTAPKNISNATTIHVSLEQLSASSTWNLLNKGTHHDSTIPEFNRTEVKGLLELVENLSVEVEKFKVIPAVKE